MNHYHFVGIGGTGLSPIARVLLERGHRVSGSDLVLSPMARELQKMGVVIKLGHDPANIEGAHILIRSSAIPDSNTEVLAAHQKGIPVMKRSDFLGELTASQKVIAVAGTHGKTTTTAMLAWCLNYLGLNPSFVVGGEIKDLNTNAHAGSGEYFVIEADEYDRMFLGLQPTILVVTNIEHDHPDCFPNISDYVQAFLDLCDRIQPDGKLIACADHPATVNLMKTLNNKEIIIKDYGSANNAAYQVCQISHKQDYGVCFDLKIQSEGQPVSVINDIQLKLPGHHNALNAAAALAVIHQSGWSLEKGRKALLEFSGTGRRFDIRAQLDGLIVIDDYAHHPTEIRSTLAAARSQYPSKDIWVVWQPHTYSRTRHLSNDFSQAFENCDHVIVTEIYASREKHQDFSSKEIVRLMSHPDARQIPTLKGVVQYLKEHLGKNDVLLVLSAGDADQISQEVAEHFKAIIGEKK